MYIATIVDDCYNVSILKNDKDEIIKSNDLEEMTNLVRAAANEYKIFKENTYNNENEFVIQEYKDAGMTEFLMYKNDYCGDELLMCWTIHKIDF